MTEPRCTLQDVSQAADELMALGCKVGAQHINDGATRLAFLEKIKAFADEVYQDIEDGVISAAQGLEAFWDEHKALRDKAVFYAMNGITLAGGVAQVELGVAVTAASYGVGVPLGALFIAHGTNNIYEGVGNIYNGPESPSTVGPTRYFYQQRAGSVYQGNMQYGSMDLMLSVGGMTRLIRKEKSIQLFRHDPINYERAYKQAGKVALFFEAAVDGVTIYSMSKEVKPD
ncbi:hypothetical protein AQS70_14675 [Pseudomonas endophytica]|uniref:DUF4225 domain-containing protein n=1 Tax=Pseudomonas endophytica TaxID=1563157 RepID=A0A0Q1CDB7_9PSED|nr:DUF4225 domain-containing protein [Pseudomonas endophytica]KQB52328.1 hypothetical protein AQS70_14675 [Pseudomonas endophytica]